LTIPCSGSEAGDTGRGHEDRPAATVVRGKIVCLASVDARER
jgi:hypothetical protein